MKNSGPLGRENRNSLDCRVKTTYDILPIHATLEIFRDYVTSRATKPLSINYIELRSGEVKRRESRRKLRTGESQSERIDRQFADKRKRVETRGKEKKREGYRRVVEKVRTEEREKCSFRCVAKRRPAWTRAPT